MSPTERLEALLPRMRRYARAICGSAEEGDFVVGNVLKEIVQDFFDIRHSRNLSVECFARLDTLLRPHDKIFVECPLALMGRLEPRVRRALLLTEMEGFSNLQAAGILGLSAAEFRRLMVSALESIHRYYATSVLIIEDEPLIAASLEKTIRQLGHDCAGVALTAREATQKVLLNNNIGLILADVRLADGSSGIAAARAIQARNPIPVVFTTAYPETVQEEYAGDPPYVINKPFKASEVRKVMGKALLAEAVS